MTPTGNLYYGHSLGLYTALYAAAVSPYEELLHMVISRGLCMQHCSEAVDSGMMAVMTYDTEAIAYVCEIVTRLGGHIYPAIIIHSARPLSGEPPVRWRKRKSCLT